MKVYKLQVTYYARKTICIIEVDRKKVITVYLRKHYEYRRNKLCLLNMLKDIIVQSTLKGKREDNNKKEEKTRGRKISKQYSFGKGRLLESYPAQCFKSSQHVDVHTRNLPNSQT